MSLIFESTYESLFIGRFKDSLESTISLAQQILGDREIDLRALNRAMPHIGGKPRESVEDIAALLMPLVEPVHGEGVAQVVDAGCSAAGLG